MTWAAAVLIGLAGLGAGDGVPVILDTDLGDDIDDTWALGMLLGTPSLDLQLIVTAHADTETKTRLVARILQDMERTDVPIGTGVKTSDNEINQAKYLDGFDYNKYPGVVYADGVGKMIELIEASDEPVTICVIGPQSNLPSLLERAPHVAEKVRIVSMAGSVYVGYNGAAEPSPEWNVRADVEAARAVFAAPWDITYAPLDICGTLRLKGDRYQTVAESENPLAKTVMANYDIWKNRPHYPEGESSVLFDTVAIYLINNDALCNMKTIKLSIDDQGNTIPDENGRPVNCAVSWKDEAAFKDLLVKSLTE
jgi:inosine-uridine nucleoside N-ribohydrolase